MLTRRLLHQACLRVSGGVATTSCRCNNSARKTTNRRTISTTTMSGHLLTLDNMNPNVKTMQYAVRGPLVIRAVELEKELKNGAKKPFKNVIRANIGDAHAMGQKPITFIRQVVACCSHPMLLDSPDIPQDVKDRANRILGGCGGRSLGSYSMSVGVEVIRKDAAAYIKKRDGGVPSNADNIVLSGGASEGIRNLMKLFVDTSKPKPAGVLIPIPQYPLYSATVAEFGLHQVGYYLDEDNNWALDVGELKRALEDSRSHCDPRLLCVINPGNPTGQVLSRENIEAIIKFAHENRLFVFADEVYQDNVYAKECKFHSFKKVMNEMGEPYSKMELASFHSVSKGFMGECGLRGGYSEIVNVHPDVSAEFQKSISAKLCSTVVGQAVMDCVVKPPKAGEPSYELFEKERSAVLKSLASRAKLVRQMFDEIEGVDCNPVQGAMYAFPRIHIPPNAIKEAKKKKQEPDFLYASQLLEATGICIIPGSGFGQKPDTYHFRTTILPPTKLLEDMLNRFKEFHLDFLKRYS